VGLDNCGRTTKRPIVASMVLITLRSKPKQVSSFKEQAFGLADIAFLCCSLVLKVSLSLLFFFSLSLPFCIFCFPFLGSVCRKLARWRGGGADVMLVNADGQRDGDGEDARSGGPTPGCRSSRPRRECGGRRRLGSRWRELAVRRV
jgi:hypothetical protein